MVIIEGNKWIAVIVILLLVGMIGHQIGEGKEFPILKVIDTGIQPLDQSINQTKELIADYYGLDQTLNHNKL